MSRNEEMNRIHMQVGCCFLLVSAVALISCVTTFDVNKRLNQQSDRIDAIESRLQELESTSTRDEDPAVYIR